jgi:ubiquinone biosynthesis protein Coq4
MFKKKFDKDIGKLAKEVRKNSKSAFTLVEFLKIYAISSKKKRKEQAPAYMEALNNLLQLPLKTVVALYIISRRKKTIKEYEIVFDKMTKYIKEDLRKSKEGKSA